MELQNIIIDFKENKLNTLFNNEHINLDFIDELIELKESFSLSFDIDFDRVVVQFTEEQHLSEPRVICSKDLEIYIFSFGKISTDDNLLFQKLKDIRVLIEDQLTNKITE